MTEAALSKLKQTLKQAGSSATKSRVEIFTALAQHGPISANGLIKEVGRKTDRATVYRTIELFEKLGIVNLIWHSAEPLVELSEIFTPHHHHALCQSCGAVTDIYGGELEALLSTLVKKHRFLSLSHTVEISGYCHNCQK